MRRLKTGKRFERDLRRIRRRGKDLDRLWSVVERLIKGGPLDRRHRLHRLSGEWTAFRECHVEPGWLLVWQCKT